MTRALLIPLCLLGLAASSLAADEAGERRQLGRQRADIEARFARESQACEQRFSVNSCLDEASTRRSAELRPLLAREDELDAVARRARAQAQRDRVAQKEQAFAAEEARRHAQPIRPVAAPASAAARAEPAPHKTRESSQTHGQAVQTELAEAEREAQRRREAAAARRLEETKRLQEQQRRDEQRAKEGKKPAPPLPVPTAAEIAAQAASAGSAPAR